MDFDFARFTKGELPQLRDPKIGSVVNIYEMPQGLGFFVVIERTNGAYQSFDVFPDGRLSPGVDHPYDLVYPAKKVEYYIVRGFNKYINNPVVKVTTDNVMSQYYFSQFKNDSDFIDVHLETYTLEI